jgi:archaellum component FlaF (FlaF/FlaG flagellin family)
MKGVCEMKQKIIEFLNTKDDDYFSFIKTLSTKKINPFANADARGKYHEMWYPRKYISQTTGQNCNIFFDVNEIDFTRFSWNFIPQFSQDKELLDLISVINQLNEEIKDDELQYRIKRLRINIFLSMSYVGSPYFDIAVYKKVSEAMYNAMAKLNKYLNHKVKIISTTYDSVMFQGNVDYTDVMKTLEPCKFKTRHYDKIIHFRNIISYSSGDVWVVKKITGTNYDDVKVQVVDCLKTLKFTDAIMLLNRTDLNEKSKSGYIKDIVIARNCLE